jgi:DNA-binding MarR family transcriptional regulator/GNAT superfamily N-acetyltransferase
MENQSAIAAVRRFNRFYTRRIGVLQEGLLESAFSLAEGRVLYELAHAEDATATSLAKELGLDSGYLSRILKSFVARKLVARKPSTSDGRTSILSLTRAGRRAFEQLDRRSSAEVAAMLAALPTAAGNRLIDAMGVIEKLLGTPPEPPVPYLLRPHRPGDMGWIIGRHGTLYADEYGLNQEFEALVADIAAKFIREFDPARECCWIAERHGEPVGSVALVKQTERLAKLRLLLVDPAARGLGIGQRLVHECIRFARQAGYKEVGLWTNDILHAARRLYERAGFRLISEEPHRSFGKDLVGQEWRLDL